MSYELRITLPGNPPSVNRRYKYGLGRAGLTAETNAWQTGATLAIRAEANRTGWLGTARTPLEISVELATPRPLARDLDNTLKAIGDSVAAALGIDDRYVVSLHASKCRADVAETLIAINAITGLI
jgi:Holliday junction resolvase RusA-like endonuclease